MTTMPQLISPSEALSGAFVLPQREESADQLLQKAASFSAYGLVVGNLGLLLPMDTFTTLIEGKLPFCRMPNTPAWLRGMVNVTGNFMPLFDLPALLEFEAESQLKTLVIGQGEDAVAVTVPRAPFRVRINPEEKMSGRPLLPGMLQPFARSCYKNDRFWVDWDVDGFFTAAGARV
jgi:chemotaxis signal transduction protein